MSFDHRFHYSAVVLDLDGVITATRHLHVEAWKRAFDEFLLTHQSQSVKIDTKFRPFDPVSDYANFVDGMPRYDGIRAFVASREISLAEGTERDNEYMETVQGLGAKKNNYYLALLEKEGPQVFRDSIEALEVWHRLEIPLAVVSSSQNCLRVLKKAGIEDFFEVRVDGLVGKRLHLRGKPEPDYFLEATRRLGVDPSQALMVEDAVAGVEAGKRGGFGAVIGMDRSGQSATALLSHGADRVVSSLKELLELKKEIAA